MPFNGRQPQIPYTVIPTEDILAEKPDEVATPNDSNLHLVSAIQISENGVYRIRFKAKTTGTVGSCWARIYKWWTPLGTQQILQSEYTEYSEDLVFSSGDRIQLYVYGDTGYNYTKNFKVCGKPVAKWAMVIF